MDGLNAAGDRPGLVLSGTYTLEPLGDALEFWLELLGLETQVRMAPYGLLFQQLLDPSSMLRRNDSGANVLFVRWSDLAGGPEAAASASWEELAPRVEELAVALSFDAAIPCLVLLGPEASPTPALERADAHLRELLGEHRNAFVCLGADAMRRYAVDRPHDPASERLGHLPFTPEGYVALATAVIRWHAAITRPPLKVFAVDADNTLWPGVVGEDGVEGVRIGAAHAALQVALAAQADAGRLVCLLSKNEEADVRAVFERHADMPLAWSQLAARRVDWEPKPANLRAVAEELELGLDGFAFLDDNPVECAEMRALCPAVSTVRVPTDPNALSRFVDHLWLLDVPTLTNEDRNRAQMYRDSAARAELRRDSGSVQAFLDGLELAVEILPATEAELPRLAQLTQRTNQFNASLQRCDEAALRGSLLRPGVFHVAVKARDRFGDYGLVGQLRANAVGNRLEVDLLTLSCRALGRGIEHRMIAAAGRHALATGLATIEVLFQHGERNQPALRFLEAAFGPAAGASAHRFVMAAGAAAALAFDPARDAVNAEEVPAPAAARAAPSGASDDRYERIAHSLTTAREIEAAIAARVRVRPELPVGFAAPAPGLESHIAQIWQEALRLRPVGAHDRFHDLGGRSIHLVQVHRLLLERLRMDIDLTTLFQHATVAMLAAHLSRGEGHSVTARARERGELMRSARTRAAAARAGAAR